MVGICRMQIWHKPRQNSEGWKTWAMAEFRRMEDMGQGRIQKDGRHGPRLNSEGWKTWAKAEFRRMEDIGQG